MSGTTHTGVTCDNCSVSNFSGTRMKCLECYDFDLCSKCYSEKVTVRTHTAQHAMQAILLPADFELYFGVEYGSGEESKYRTYTCSYCASPGFLERQLVEHIRCEHASEMKEVMCPICVASPNSRFESFQLGNLAQHIESCPALRPSTRSGTGADQRRYRQQQASGGNSASGNGNGGMYSTRFLRRARQFVPSAGSSGSRGVVDVSASPLFEGAGNTGGGGGGLEPVSEFLLHLAQAKRQATQSGSRQAPSNVTSRGWGSDSMFVPDALFSALANGGGGGDSARSISRLINSGRGARANGGNARGGTSSGDGKPLSGLVAMSRMEAESPASTPIAIKAPKSHTEYRRQANRAQFVRGLLWSTMDGSKTPSPPVATAEPS